MSKLFLSYDTNQVYKENSIASLTFMGSDYFPRFYVPNAKQKVKQNKRT